MNNGKLNSKHDTKHCTLNTVEMFKHCTSSFHCCYTWASLLLCCSSAVLFFRSMAVLDWSCSCRLLVVVVVGSSRLYWARGWDIPGEDIKISR